LDVDDVYSLDTIYTYAFDFFFAPQCKVIEEVVLLPTICSCTAERNARTTSKPRAAESVVPPPAKEKNIGPQTFFSRMTTLDTGRGCLL